MEYRGINYNNVIDIKSRKPTGIMVSPYEIGDTLVYAINNSFGGIVNFDLPKKFNPIGSKYGRKIKGENVKIMFLGDVMLSKDGIFPQIKSNLKNLLSDADIIVANIEGPVVDSEVAEKRGLLLSFLIHSHYFEPLYQCNKDALWILNIANNHLCDNAPYDDPESTKTFDRTGIALRKIFKHSIVIGAKSKTGVRMVAEIRIKNGPTIGIIGWTDVMNSDKNCYHRSVLRGSDLSPNKIKGIKKDFDFLIGFPHGNVEQNLAPKPESRVRWLSLLDEDKFDIIVGHGPHVVQLAEEFRGRLLFNSIGNFYGPKGRDQTRIGYIPELTIHFDKERLLSDISVDNHLIENDIDSIYIIRDKEDSIYPKTYDLLKKQNYPMLN